MSTITTRAGKGAPLTYAEMDANFTALNADKLEASALTPYETTAHASATYETQASATQYLKAANNLSDVPNVADAQTNLNVPTRTGGNASGTWGINITGSASTATSATTAGTASTIADGAVSTTAKLADGIVTQAKLAHNLLELTANAAGVTTIELTGIPSWASQIDILFDTLLPAASGQLRVQVGTPTYVTAGYTAVGGANSGDAALATGFPVASGALSVAYTGTMTLKKFSSSSNVWIMSSLGLSSAVVQNSAGRVDVGAALTAVRVNLATGGNFTSGNVTIRYS